MIVRINQIDLSAAEKVAGWGAVGPRGPIQCAWPGKTFVYHLVILEKNERKQPLSIGFRQNQTRQLITKVIDALSERERRTVLRLDGLWAADELPAVMPYLTDAHLSQRYVVRADKMDITPTPALASIRLVPAGHLLAELCNDPHLGLERSVRLRALNVPEEIVNPLLDITETDDERWGEIVAQADFVLSTAKNLLSLLVWTRRFDPTQAKQRILRQLAGQ